MIDSVSLQWLCTVAFAAIGAYYLARLLRAPGSERVSSAAHLAMCAAMILMVWPWGMDVPALPQQVVFGLATAWFLLLAVRATPAGHLRSRVTHGQHAILMAAMVWMLATMPASMTGHASSMNMPGMNMSAMPSSGMPTYQTVITVAVGIYCLVSALPLVVRRTNANLVCQGAMSAGMGALLFVMV
jgi:hypothetical protein